MMKLTVTLALVFSACFLMVHAEDKTCPCMMTLEYFPQCGTDGVTYPSESALKCRNKCNPSTHVRIAHRGICGSVNA